MEESPVRLVKALLKQRKQAVNAAVIYNTITNNENSEIAGQKTKNYKLKDTATL